MLKIFFSLPRLPHDFLLQLLCKKSFFWAISVGTPLGPLFFSCLFFHVFSFSFYFSIYFHVFFLFSFVFPFNSFIFLLFSLKKSSFFIVFLFFPFSGAQNLWRHSRNPWGKVHILCWLSLLCIGSSSLFPVEWCTFWWWSGWQSYVVGGGWVKSYLRTRIARLVPSMRRLTHLSLVSSLFSHALLSSVSRQKNTKIISGQMQPGNHYGRFTGIRGSFAGSSLCVAGIPCENQKLLLVIIMAGMVSHRTFSSQPPSRSAHVASKGDGQLWGCGAGKAFAAVAPLSVTSKRKPRGVPQLSTFHRFSTLIFRTPAAFTTPSVAMISMLPVRDTDQHTVLVALHCSCQCWAVVDRLSKTLQRVSSKHTQNVCRNLAISANPKETGRIWGHRWHRPQDGTWLGDLSFPHDLPENNSTFASASSHPVWQTPQHHWWHVRQPNFSQNHLDKRGC